MREKLYAKDEHGPKTPKYTGDEAENIAAEILGYLYGNTDEPGQLVSVKTQPAGATLTQMAFKNELIELRRQTRIEVPVVPN
jgi:hypothetical protein